MDTKAALATLDEGIQWVTEEQDLLREERTALESFAARLERIDPEPVVQSSAGLGATRTLDSTPGRERLAAVREAYRETVMDVDHYEAEYGEPFAAHVHNEFGPDLAAAVEHASALSPALHGRFRSAVATAIEGRAVVGELLATEAESLRELHERLVPVHGNLEEVDACPFADWTTDALLVEYDRIESFRDRCEALATDRQRTRQEYVLDRQDLPDPVVTEGYLYGPLETDHPGLAALAVFGDRLRRTADGLRIELLGRNCPPRDRDGTRVDTAGARGPGTDRTAPGPQHHCD